MNKKNLWKSSIILLLAILFSCNRETSLKVIPTREFSVQYRRDTLVVTESNNNSKIFNYCFVLRNGEYYSVDNGKMELFLSIKRDTIIHGNNESGIRKTKTYIGRLDNSPYYRKGEEVPPNGKYITECYQIDEDVKDFAKLQRAYYYDENYNIVGIKEFGYNDYR